jgi:hemerythrin superfamily protein
MPGLSDNMAEDHRYCDGLFAEAEQAARKGDWALYRGRLRALADALGRHFAFEEDELFPAFERASGMSGGPTEVMREEHSQMKDMLTLLQAAAPEQDPEGCLGELDTLFTLLQQHNVKEEAMLYPACEQMPGADALAAGAAALAGARAHDRDGALDVRGLEPPEPMHRILDALGRDPEAPLRVRIHREPYPLYELLQEQGYRWRTTHLHDGSFELLIDRARP